MFRRTRLLCLAIASFLVWSAPAPAQNLSKNLITREIDENQLVPLPHNTHRLARAEFDRGTAPADLPMSRMILVLNRSADTQHSLDLFLGAQLDESSTQYHKWLTPQEFGQRFGAADADIAKVTTWLQSHGFAVGGVSNGRNLIEFSGSVDQVQQAFHTEIHRYVVNGKSHWANSSDPQIPAALSPLVAGVATLHNFRKTSQIASIKPNAAKIDATGLRPRFTASDGTHALSPADFSVLYDMGPLTAKGIIGTRSTIAVVARSDIHMSDIQDFQNAFGIPKNLPQVVINGTDPGDSGDGDEAEAVLDTSWSAALAPAATVKLVVSASTNTTDGVDLSEEYIINHNLADVMTESFGDCEANYTQAEAQFYSALAQQAAAQGITYTVAVGDSGATGCDDPNSVTVASGPVSVNVLAATPYNIAVGGTQFNENGNDNAYWSGSNGSTFASAIAQIPENAWNESCTAAQCGSNAGIWAGSGGASIFFTKPSWQAGVAGMPSDGARDIPDVSFTSASHDFYLLCLDGSCTSQRGESTFSGISGTSAATPAVAAVMALVVQARGARQGQAAASLYRLAAQEQLTSCNVSNTSSPPASTCIFRDVTVGNNAVPGEAGYGSSTAKYQAGVGYDLTTGLGSVDVANLVSNWSGSGIVTPQIRIGIESPSSLDSTVIGLTTFSGWALTDSGSVSSVAISVDSVPYSNANYGIARTDICALYSSANCPNVGWSYFVDTTALAAGAHTMAVTVTSSTGQVYTASSMFTVANWTASNPTTMSIDNPNSNSLPFSSTAYFGGWALSTLSAINQVAVSIDGLSYGLAEYGGSRPDVCNQRPGAYGCPDVGWNFSFDTTKIADGSHTLAVTSLSAGNQYATISQNFTVANTAANPITISIDTPSTQNAGLSGYAGLGGWAISPAVPISNITVAIDGVLYGNATYGGARPDVCRSHSGALNCPDVGWNFGLDTTRLINGTHALTVSAYTTAGQSTLVTRSFSVSNRSTASAVLAGFDTPGQQNSIMLGPVTFTGWAIDLNAVVNSVTVAIDGSVRGTASYGASRPDVCTIYPSSSNCPNVGWKFEVDSTQLANGTHTVTITIAAGSGTNTLSSVFTVENWATNNPMKVSIDTPNSQSGPLSGSLGIGGWAIDQISAIGNVVVAVDSVPLGDAFYGGNRSDVCNKISAPGCPNVGWNFVLDTTLFADGNHILAVTGATTQGRNSTFTTSFQTANAGSSPLRISIDTPSSGQLLTGTSPVGGWALADGGPTVVSVEVLVDGVLNGTATYGGDRADVCARISATGCPNVGWNYELDTAPFVNGTHTLEARAQSSDGKKFTASTTFTVANQP
jgi:pro-kumamolisin-like protein/subtilase family protein